MEIIKKITITLTSIFVVLLTLELGIRLYGWKPLPQTYEGKKYSSMLNGRLECMNPEVSRPYFNGGNNPNPGCVFYSINNLDLRNNYPVNEKKPETKRIVVIGDSFTYGFGVLEEDTFESKLEEMWRLENQNIEVLNAAKPAAALPEYRKILDEKVSELKPDVLIVGINLNDIMTFNTSLIIENVSKNYNWTLRKYSRLIDFYCYTMERRASSEENIKTILSTLTPDRLESLVQFTKYLKSFSEKHNSRLYVIVHPVFFNLENYPFTHVHEKINQILSSENIPFHDFLNEFKGKKSEDYWITKNDQHPNELAHQTYFDVLFKEIKP